MRGIPAIPTVSSVMHSRLAHHRLHAPIPLRHRPFLGRARLRLHVGAQGARVVDDEGAEAHPARS